MDIIDFLYSVTEFIGHCQAISYLMNKDIAKMIELK